MSIVSDTGWKFEPTTSIPRRGINDYVRFVTFSRRLREEEIQMLRGFLSEDPKCPGWTGVWIGLHVEADNLTTYRCSTTLDSSD